MTTTTTPAKPRAWFPAYEASLPGPGGAVELVASELLSRTPADVLLTDFLEGYAADDFDRVGEDGVAEAIFDLRSAAYRVGCAVPGIVADLGQPGPGRWEPYLAELAVRARVPQVPGRVEDDGMFHEEERR